ncbi:soluble scavenger receptor cysteine-rich domain-containing protein SSC5D-like [Ischnura elegans]|uniref:soluble scavenger receptor cysteine-rich domain-containing protein SSC5D-like n=1 Tax=Ischnura elegans TaxID=197161 RepID=UPI001ED8B0B7|nr:soluble scavenger receptor cysteine-rich domain-containing protein SSC5D-like [Ischnura elegans]
MQVHQVDSTMLLATEFFNDTVVHLGTNNLICGETPERVVEHQQELLTRIRLRNPKVRLFLSSVLKRRVNYFKSWTLQRNLYIEEMNLKIDKLNMLMKQLALRMNVVFIDNWREFEAQSQDPFEFFLGRDGLHLSRRGLRVLTGNVYRACLQARRDYPRSLACLPPAPSPASSPAPSPASSPAPSPASSSAPSPGHHPLSSPSFSDGAGMNASLPSFSYSDALCSNLPLHNDLMQVSSFQPSVRPLHLPSVTRTNASSYSSPPLSPSSSTPSCFKFTTVTRRGNHHCNKPKIVPKHSSSFKIPLNNRWSSLSSLNDSFMPSFSSVANRTKKQSCIKKKSISPKMFPSSAFCRPSSLPLISDVRNTNKDGTTKEFPARLCRQIGFKLKNPLTDRLTIKIQNGGSSEGKLDIHSTLYPRKCPNCNKV